MRFVPLLVLLFATSSLAADDNRDIEKAAYAFYRVYLKVQPSGVPQENEQKKFNPYLSGPLNSLLKRANQAERKYYRATKGESPPLAEGDLFTSLFEGAAAFKVLSCEKKHASGSCLVELTYVDPGDKSSFKWKDRAYLVKESRGWRLDDIEFLGNWEFMHKGHLKTILADIIKQGER